MKSIFSVPSFCNISRDLEGMVKILFLVLSTQTYFFLSFLNRYITHHYSLYRKTSMFNKAVTTIWLLL